jgi:hypothetical protein
MRGKYRHDQRGIQQRSGPRAVDALRGQPLQCLRHIVAGLALGALAILGKVCEHGKQHEPADEGQGLVQAERLEAAIDSGSRRDPAEAIDRRGPDALDTLEQRVTAVGADDVAEQLPEVADVGVLRDRCWRRRHEGLHSSRVARAWTITGRSVWKYFL